MIFGILKEDFVSERRVALTPSAVESLAAAGHQVYVEHDAGSLSHYPDDEYRGSGGTIAYSPQEVLSRADTVLKIAPPTDAELAGLTEEQTLFAALHLAIARRTRLEALLEKRTCAIALELIENPRGELALLHAMGEIAGLLSIHAAAQFLQAGGGGRGILLGSVPGVPAAVVVVLGGGMVGRTAVRAALGLGARVVVLDRDLKRLREISELFQWRVTTAISDRHYVAQAVKEADVVIGAVSVHGGEKAPTVVTEAMVKQMKPGSVIIDVAIDEGGCVETSRPTTLADPVFVAHGVIHYCVPNIPAAVARTASIGLSNTLLTSLHELGSMGVAATLKADTGLASAVCTLGGYCTNRAVGRVFGIDARELSSLLP